ncbi:MAG: zinc-dependent metalloprotease, partial [Planctomycetaceae bacterium]|nr:zinc-dependent metalloprotease [Planctomycetaceae bacterium]
MKQFQRNTRLGIILGISIFSAGMIQLNAQEVKPPVKAETSASTVAGSTAKKEDRPKPIKEVLPDAQKIDGLITLYRKKEKLYAEIKSSNLNTDYLIAMAIAKGSGWSAIGGYTLQDSDEDWLWQFRKVNDSIQIVRRNIRFKADSGTPEAKAVEVAYSDSILYSLPILAIGDGGGDVIDMASVFMSDLPKLGRSIGGSFARDRSTWGNVKGFSNNIEFRVAATYSVYRYSYYGYSYGSNDSPDANSVGVTIHYSVSKLPSTGYTSRLADNRIGYFTTTHKNFSRNEKDDHLVRYINRWNIQKADSSATLSPPKKPVVFWIEKTVPFKYRHAVREGILEWNKAFEKIGIVNAIEVRQQSDSDTWDAEDINYNTIRWITSDAGFAMGPSHVNPLNGEILDADIIIDAGFIDYWKDRFDYFIADLIPPESDKKSDKKDDLASVFMTHYKKHEEAQQEVAHSHSGLNGCFCTDAKNKATQIALASIAVSLMDDDNDDATEEEKEKEKEEKKEENKEENADKTSDEKSDETKESEKESEKNNGEKADDKKSDNADEKTDEKKEDGDSKKDTKKDDKKDAKKSPKQEKEKARAEKLERIILAGIKDLVMHEVGHTLGLRHNFKASSWLTLEEINKPDRSKEFGIAGSVMDYLPINVAPKGQPQGDYFMSTLGPYDYLAIEYGY